MANPGITTLATIRTACQQGADMVNSTFISNAEWNSLINSSIQELYDKLVQAYQPSNWYGKTATFTTDGTNYQHNLTQTGAFAGSPIATDYYVGLGVDLQYVSSQPQSWVSLRPFSLMERNRWSFPTYLTTFGWTNLHYAYVGDTLWLKPTPQAGQIIQLIYAPRFTLLVGDSDTFDGINGYEEWVRLNVIIRAKAKEESDAQIEMMLLAAQEKRIEQLAANRDAGSPGRVVDTQWSNGSGYGGSGGMGGDGGSWF
jgi:hypothetical protein